MTAVGEDRQGGGRGREIPRRRWSSGKRGLGDVAPSDGEPGRWPILAKTVRGLRRRGPRAAPVVVGARCGGAHPDGGACGGGAQLGVGECLATTKLRGRQRARGAEVVAPIQKGIREWGVSEGSGESGREKWEGLGFRSGGPGLSGGGVGRLGRPGGSWPSWGGGVIAFLFFLLVRFVFPFSFIYFPFLF